jgi:hypothetical protein
VITVDTISNTMRVQVTWRLCWPEPRPHTSIAAPAVPLTPRQGLQRPPAFPGFPNGLTSGTYDMTFNMLLASCSTRVRHRPRRNTAQAWADLSTA